MKRRLSDKLLDACQHAVEQGRMELARRLQLLLHSLLEDELAQGYERRLEDEAIQELEDEENVTCPQCLYHVLC